jgi:uncharacterized protein (TIGR00369 family)
LNYEQRIAILKNRFDEEPLAKLCAISLTWLDPDRTTMVMSVSEDLTIVGGAIQGGATTILADYCGVYAAMSAVESGHTPCRSINIHFTRPAFVGETLTATAKVVNVSRTTVLVDVEVIGPATKATPGRLIARAQMEFARQLPK